MKAFSAWKPEFEMAVPMVRSLITAMSSTNIANDGYDILQNGWNTLTLLTTSEVEDIQETHRMPTKTISRPHDTTDFIRIPLEQDHSDLHQAYTATRRQLQYVCTNPVLGRVTTRGLDIIAAVISGASCGICS